MTDKAWTEFSTLTDTRVAVLKFVRVEGVASASDIVRIGAVRGNNKRAAIRALKDLHAMGYLVPVRTCEYLLTDLGRKWVDNYRALHDLHNGQVRNPDESRSRR